MYNNTPSLPIRDNVKLWNKTATDCYELKCQCEKCFIYKTYFKENNDKCMMKYYVMYLLEKIGHPPKIHLT